MGYVVLHEIDWKNQNISILKKEEGVRRGDIIMLFISADRSEMISKRLTSQTVSGRTREAALDVRQLRQA